MKYIKKARAAHDAITFPKTSVIIRKDFYTVN